jgi:Uma2 family endonuclease
MATQQIPLLTPEEYLATERTADVKHEYIAGEVFAMSGGSYLHARIAANIIRSLGNQLERDPCEVATSDLRIRVERTGMFTYPDVVVICGEPRFYDGVFDTLLNPYLIVEVLSESTEAYDRGEKFAHYRTITSLQHYLLVSQTRQRIEHFARQHDGSWALHVAEQPSGAVILVPNKLQIDLATVYEHLNVPIFQIADADEEVS